MNLPNSFTARKKRLWPRSQKLWVPALADGLLAVGWSLFPLSLKGWDVFGHKELRSLGSLLGSSVINGYFLFNATCALFHLLGAPWPQTYFRYLKFLQLALLISLALTANK